MFMDFLKSFCPKRTRRSIVGIICLLGPGLALAANLFQVYQQASLSDPVFKSAEAEFLTTRENVPIAAAQLRPNIGITGSTLRQLYNQHTPEVPIVLTPQQLALVGPIDYATPSGTFYNTADNYELNVTQPIFNLGAWQSLKNAHAQVKQAQANYCVAAQDLIVRTAQAYFDVLQANDALNSILANKKAVSQELYQTTERHKVEMATDADLQNTKASYVSVSADEIAARNDLADAVNRLQVITGIKYKNLLGATSVPLVRPRPDNLTVWIATAEAQNYELLAARYGAEAAKQNIKVQSAGHWPEVDLTGGYQFQHNTNYQGSGVNQYQAGQAGVSVEFPVYQGGLVNSQTRQATYQYEQAIANMEQTHRKIVEDTENAYLKIITSIGKLRADQETIAARQKSLQATQYSYNKGLRTIYDVLNIQSSLYQAKIDYSKDLYDYLLNTILLKQAAGTLSATDLVAINSWLHVNNNIGAQVAKIR